MQCKPLIPFRHCGGWGTNTTVTTVWSLLHPASGISFQPAAAQVIDLTPKENSDMMMEMRAKWWCSVLFALLWGALVLGGAVLPPELQVELSSRIEAARAQGKVPVYYVDLDDTVFMNSGRYEFMLHAFDRINGTTFFESLVPGSVKSEQLDQLIVERVVNVPRTPLREIFLRRKVRKFVLDARARAGVALHDHIHKPIVEAILAAKAKGARIVYVTARRKRFETDSRRQIQAAGLPLDDIFHLVDEKQTTPDYKVNAVNTYEAAHPEVQSVAFFDDSGLNVVAMREAHPGILSVHVTLEGCEQLLLRSD